jgi:sulfide dehydrogenase cytochrome subunit
MRYAFIVATVLLLPFSVLAEGAPPSAQICAACHGESGPSAFPGIPTIHGLPEVVIENALYDFRGHTRPCRKSACSTQGSCPDMDMCMVAEHMSHEDMEVLGQWFASRPWVHAKEDFDNALAVRGRAVHEEQCEICHTGGGTDPLDEASILRGQRAGYLRKALSDYMEGRRMAVAAMDARFKQITDDQAAALIAFYTSPVGTGD